MKRLYLGAQVKGLPSEAVEKLRAMSTFLQEMKDPAPLKAFPLRRAHPLTGERKGIWSLHVTRNWRLTFEIKAARYGMLIMRTATE